MLKYPTSGENLSPFLFGDWDGNGTEDAAVLYTCNAKGQNVCLSILEKIGDAWQVTQEVEGLSTEVESVSLAAMDSSPAQQLLVGYTSSRGDQYLSVYAYQERTLHTVLQQSYEGWLLADVTEMVNQAIKELTLDGTVAEIAAKYGLTDALVPVEAE